MKKATVLLLTGLLSLNFMACSNLNIKGNDNPLSENPSETSKTAFVAGETTAVNTVCFDTLTQSQKDMYTALLEGFENFSPEIVITGDEQDIEIAYKNIIADHPEIFYLSGYIYKDTSDILKRKEFTIYPSYTEDKDKYDELMKDIEAAADEWLSDIPEDASSYKKSKLIFEKVVDNTTYKKDCTHNQDMASVFLYGQSVCGGYTQGYSYLMQRLGIPCAVIYGELEGTPHAWNVSILDNAYYMSDPTNGDGSFTNGSNEKIEYINYNYLNIMPAYTADYVPSYSSIKCTDDKDNYYIKEDRYFEEFTENIVGQIVADTVEEGKRYVTFCYGSPEALNLAEDILFAQSHISRYYDSTQVNFIDSTRFNTLTIFF